MVEKMTYRLPNVPTMYISLSQYNECPSCGKRKVVKARLCRDCRNIIQKNAPKRLRK